MQAEHGELYLHHPLKHVCQREKGDVHICFGGFQKALDDHVDRRGRRRHKGKNDKAKGETDKK